MAIDAANNAQPAIDTPAFMQTLPSSRLDGYASLGSQYIYRGVALRDSGVTPTVEITFNHRSGWFIDTWAGQVDIYNYYAHDTEREWQTDISVGYAAELTSNWQWSLARAWINNFDNSLPESENYQEWRLNLFYRDNLSTQLAYTDNYRQLGIEQWNIETKWSYGIGHFAIGEVGVGHSHSEGNEYDSYNYGWLGVQKHWLATDWKLAWHYSSDGARTILDDDRAGSRVELTLSWSLF